MPSIVVLPQIFFYLATLFSYLVFFCLFHVSLDVLFTSLYFSDPLGSILFFLRSLLLSHRSRISAMIQVFFLFFWRCLQRISLAVTSPVQLYLQSLTEPYLPGFTHHQCNRIYQILYITNTTVPTSLYTSPIQPYLPGFIHHQYYRIH